MTTTPIRKGPRVVALGGGHGLSTTLRAVRLFAHDITGIVSVADDGGSSGRLRAAFGIPAPGDLRLCISSLASDPDSTWARAFEHRFTTGELEGHALGNLVIAGLAETTGSFTAAVQAASDLVGIVGRVLPATVEPVVLKAEASAGVVEGQVAVSTTGRISCVSLVPADPRAPDDALDAIATADMVVIGPGSLFTSILAVVAVPALREALAAANATKVYVCNIRPQVPETEGYDTAAHVDALVTHGLEVDVVLRHPDSPVAGPLHPALSRAALVEAPIVRPDGLAHDPTGLAAALADLVG